MIVDSMTLQEIHKELHNDFSNTVGTLDNRLRKFGSVVLKSSRYPVRRHYECKSIEKRNRFWVMLTAIKRGEWNDPVIDYYCVFDRPEGLFCAFLDPKGGNSFVFPPHFFSRYRERVLGGSDMSGPDLIKFFVNRIWLCRVLLFQRDLTDLFTIEQQKQYDTHTDGGISKIEYRTEEYKMIATYKRHPLGPFCLDQWEIKHIHHLTHQEGGIARTERHKVGLVELRRIIENKAVEHTVDQIACGTCENHRQTNKITYLCLLSHLNPNVIA